MSKVATADLKLAIGQRLAAVRGTIGLGQFEFAEKLGISGRGYANYERGERELPSAVIVALAERMKIDPLWLLTGPGDEPVLIGRRSMDFDLLESIETLIEDWLVKHRRALKPDKKARVLRLAYEHCVEAGAVNTAHVREMLSLAA